MSDYQELKGGVTMFTTAHRPADAERDQVLQEQQQAQKLPNVLLRKTHFPNWPIPTHDNGLADDWDESVDELYAHR